jgi:hypothetical protein
MKVAAERSTSDRASRAEHFTRNGPRRISQYAKHLSSPRCIHGFNTGEHLPMGGAELTPEQVSAEAAYIWALSHRTGST